MKEIPLTHGQTAIVDDDNYERLSAYSWHANRSASNYYAATTMGDSEILMHRMVIECKGQHVDHINGNGLDNRRANLRACNATQNHQNTRRIWGASQFKGVHRCRNKWRAQIVVDGKKIHLGVFTDEQDAAKTYDDAAMKNFGEFAATNAAILQAV